MESELQQWWKKQYISSIDLNSIEGGVQYKRIVSKFPEPSKLGETPLTGGRSRMRRFVMLRTGYPLGPSGYGCLAMAARVKKATAHYAYAYWRLPYDEASSPEYICISPTFDSRDGEYRHGFIRYPTYAAGLEKTKGIVSDVEKEVLALIEKGSLTLDATAYGPDEEKLVRSAERLPLTAFAVCLLIDIWESRPSMAPLHLSPAFSALIAAVAEESPELIRLSQSFMTSPERALFVTKIHDVACGQKTVPMISKEVAQPFDANYAVWRELVVMQAVSDLVINYISPAFPLFNQWTYVTGADPSLFDNPAMLEKYARGEAAKEASRHLREARDTLKLASGRDIAELDRRVYDDISYANGFLITSPVAMLYTMEHVGLPLGFLVKYVHTRPNPPPAFVSILTAFDHTARIIFDLVYGAHCLHTKLGVAHGDLHGNNVALYSWGLPYLRPGQPVYDDPLLMYVTGPRGETDSYLFPTNGTYACIIDFSRCILGPNFSSRTEKEHGEAYTSSFYRNQENRVLRTLYKYAPEFVKKNEAALRSAVLTNYEGVFRTLCAVDFIAIGGSLRLVLSEAEEAREGAEFASRIEREARELFVTELQRLIESPTATPPYPGAQMLKSFSHWAYAEYHQRDPKRLRQAQLVDAYNYNNSIRYRSDDYAKFPPWSRLDEIEKRLGNYKLTDLIERGFGPLFDSYGPRPWVETEAERTLAEQRDLSGPEPSKAEFEV